MDQNGQQPFQNTDYYTAMLQYVFINATIQAMGRLNYSSSMRPQFFFAIMVYFFQEEMFPWTHTDNEVEHEITGFKSCGA